MSNSPIHRRARIFRILERAIGVAGLAALLAGAELGAAGCAARARGTVWVQSSPPPPRRVVVETRPGLVWVDGYWAWDQGHWRWRDGYWARARPGYVYIQGRWIADAGRYRWSPGRWTVYRTRPEERVRVRDRRQQQQRQGYEREDRYRR